MPVRSSFSGSAAGLPGCRAAGLPGCRAGVERGIFPDVMELIGAELAQPAADLPPICLVLADAGMFARAEILRDTGSGPG